jgi:hypothetical protein
VALSHPKSDAAKAFAALMTRYLPAADVPESQGRRRLLARKA